MKKIFRTIACSVAAVCMVSALASCSSGGSSDDLLAEPAVEFETKNAIGNVVTFKVTENSVTEGDGTNKFVMSLRRSATGAAEKIIVQDATYNYQINGGKVISKSGDLSFALNDYGACFCFDDGEDSKPALCTGDHYDESGKIKNDADKAEYQVELGLTEDFKKGDTVKFQLVSGKIAGEGAALKDDLLPKVKIGLIDGHKAVDWYKVLFEYTKEKGFPKVFKEGADVEDGEDKDYGLLSAEFSTGGWAGNTKVAGTAFADVVAGDKIVVTYKIDNDEAATYHMFQICLGDDAAVFYAEFPSLAEDGTVSYTIAAEDIDGLKANGILIQGNYVVITKVTLGDASTNTDPASGENLLSGEKALTWGESVVSIGAAKFNNATDADTISITISGTNQIKLITPSWSNRFVNGTIVGGAIENKTNPKLEDGETEDTSYGRIDFDEGVTTVEWTPTAEDWAVIKEEGLGIIGPETGKVTDVHFTSVQ